MRILSARAREIALDRARKRVLSTVILLIEHQDGRQDEVRIRTSAPIRSTGAAPLRDRLIASAKLILAMSGPSSHRPPEAEAAHERPAA